MAYNTILFDFDYTLADSSRGIVLCFRHVLTQWGFDEVSDEEIKRTIGKSLEESFSLLTGITDAEEIARMKREYVLHANECMTVNTHLFPEVKEALYRLKAQGIRLGILSTKYRYRILEFVEKEFTGEESRKEPLFEGTASAKEISERGSDALSEGTVLAKEISGKESGISFFDLIVGGEDVKHLKPHPEGLLMAIEQLQADPAKTLYVGDSTVDAATAQAAGIDFAGMLHGVTPREELEAYPHVAVFSSLDELLPLVQPLLPTPEVEETKWVAWWKLPILYLMGGLAWDELVQGRLMEFPVWLLLFFVTLWWTFRDRRILPLPVHRKMMQRLLPLRRWMRLFHIRVARGKRIAPRETGETVCKCCGEIYVGNFCPRCGQTYQTLRYRLSNALANIAGGFFNIDSGFSRTLIELLYRPGHLIREFINGKRAIYFRPFQMLFIMAALYIMAVQLVDPEAFLRQQKEEQMAKVDWREAKRAMEEEIEQNEDSATRAVQWRILNAIDSKYRQKLNSSESAQTATEGKEVTASGAAKAAAEEKVGATSGAAKVTAEEKESTTSGVAEEKYGREETKPKEGLRRYLDEDAVSDWFARFVESHPFVKRIVDLLKGWFHGNKAFLVIFTLPLVALAARFTFRKKQFRPRYNTTEHLFIQAFIACQLLLFSILVLLLRGKAHVGDLYELSIPSIFLLYCFDYKQLYRCNWWTIFWRITKMMLYGSFLLLLLAILVATFIGVFTFGLADE